MKKIILIIIINLLQIGFTKAQYSKTDTGQAIVGQPCPDLFFNKTINYKKSSFKLHELQGKWVVLDFWGEGCSSCIASFPHISELQKKFKDKVEFLMATYVDDKPEKIRESIFNHYNKKLNLAMPCVFTTGHSTKFDGILDQFDIGGLPFVVIVDPNGIVRAVTAVVLKQQQITELLEGKLPYFRSAAYNDRKNEKALIPYDGVKPFLVNGNGGPDTAFSYRSLLSKWTPNMFGDYILGYLDSTKKGKLTGRLEIMGTSIVKLYRLAYTGCMYPSEIIDKNVNLWHEIKLETRDSILFSGDGQTGENMFNYSQIVPKEKGSKERMLKILRNDLNSYFGYDVTFETRQEPYLKLVIVDSTLAKTLASKGGEYGFTNPHPKVDVRLTNGTMKDLIILVRAEYGGDMIFSDETGIKRNIDIPYWEIGWGNKVELEKNLKRYGLALMPAGKPMKVLVIRDPLPTKTEFNN